MNLWFLARNGDQPFYVTTGDVKIAGLSAATVSPQMGSYNALSLAPGASIRLPGASHWYPLRNFQTNLGWVGASTADYDSLDISFVLPSTQEIAARSSFTFNRTPVPVFVPYKPDGMNVYDLVIDAPVTNTQSVTLGVMQNITHDKFYALATGRGVEIGPGPNPRVKQSDTTEVTYLERYGQETYLKYNHGYSPILQDAETLWKSYRVGSAHEIPDDLGELDFIFSAHMVEHLPNPLGHFRLWHSRLSEKGRVLGIVPAIKGCFDFMFNEPTTLSEWVSLLDSDLSRPQPWQYDKYVNRYKRTREDMVAEDIRPHFSFFTEENLADFLKWCCDNLGYSGFSIRTGINNVSIEFSLNK